VIIAVKALLAAVLRVAATPLSCPWFLRDFRSGTGTVCPCQPRRPNLQSLCAL